MEADEEETLVQIEELGEDKERGIEIKLIENEEPREVGEKEKKRLIPYFHLTTQLTSLFFPCICSWIKGIIVLKVLHLYFINR
jgi:hypothetical protein